VKKIVVTGATGLIGRHLVAALRARGDEVVALSRHAAGLGGATAARWDPSTSPLPDAAVEGADALVNLAGEPIGKGRWTADRRRRIGESREIVTRRCVDALGRHETPVLVSASAIGYYGSTEDPVAETAPEGADFLAGVCGRWESVAQRGDDLARVVRVRTGIVLARDGGAFPRLLQATRLGAAGPLGSGRQWMSWIHLDDEVAVLLECIDSDTMRGPVNAVAPTPIRQREFASTLARLMHRPCVVPAPAALLRLVLGEMADLLLVGQRVVPAVLNACGFEWDFVTPEQACGDLLARDP
jgi:hypothetical protein